ncbi:MAG: hypothetical protein ACM3XM_00340, partial [Mycobacterium leprae]
SSIWLFPVDGGEPRTLDNWDLAIGDTVGADVRNGGGIDLTWAPDGNVIYVSVSERGACVVYGFPVAGGKPYIQAGGQREIYGGSFDANCELFAFVAGDIHHIGDLYLLDTREYTETKLTDVNGKLWAELELSEVE